MCRIRKNTFMAKKHKKDQRGKPSGLKYSSPDQGKNGQTIGMTISDTTKHTRMSGVPAMT